MLNTTYGLYKTGNGGVSWTLMTVSGTSINGANWLRSNPITAGQFLAGATGNGYATLAAVCTDSQPLTTAGTVTCTNLANMTSTYGVDWGKAKNAGQSAIFLYGEYNGNSGAFVSYDGWTTVQQIGPWMLKGDTTPAPLGVNGGLINFPGFIAGDYNHVGVMYLCWTPGLANGCSFYNP